MNLSPHSHLLTTNQAAEILALRSATLKKWRVLGIGPKYVRVGPRTIRYRWVDLKNFIDSQQSLSEGVR